MNEARYLTVTELASLLNLTLEGAFPNVLFSGEISQFQSAASGHCYFTLKDDRAQLSCVMWSGTARTLKFKPGQGMEVRCQARPNLYPPSGRLQLIVSKMEQAGEGLLQRKFLELKAKLEKEGLFDAARKRPIPFLPRGLGIVTSKQGAVIHDIMVRLKDRMPQLPVYLVDVRVQGEGAAQEIAAAIKFFNTLDCVDVLIVGRGGGSLEDLWAFNEEPVVRAIFASRIPVVSAVGHESDVSLADLAADVRAPTPTAAAEMVVPHRADLLRGVAELERRLLETDRWLMPLAQQVDELERRLGQGLSAMVDRYSLRVRNAELLIRMLEPRAIIERMSGSIDELRGRLSQALKTRLEREAHSIDRLEGRLRSFALGAGIEARAARLDGLAQRFAQSTARYVEVRAERLENLGRRLESLNPSQVLKRGYALVRQRGAVVVSAHGVAVGAELEVALGDGDVSAAVTSVRFTRPEPSDSIRPAEAATSGARGATKK